MSSTSCLCGGQLDQLPPDAIEKYLIDEGSWFRHKLTSYQGKELVTLIRNLSSANVWKINTGNDYFNTKVRKHRVVVVYSDLPIMQAFNVFQDETKNEIIIQKPKP